MHFFASYSNVGHKGPREFLGRDTKLLRRLLIYNISSIYKTVTCIDDRKWFIAVCWMIYPGIYKYIWNYLCKLISSESGYNNSLMFGGLFWSQIVLITLHNTTYPQKFCWIMIFDFDFELLLYDICCDELWYETNNNHQKKSSKFESDIHIIAAKFLWISYIVKSYQNKPWTKWHSMKNYWNSGVR